MEAIVSTDIPAFAHLVDETFAEVRSFTVAATPKRKGLPYTERLLQQIGKALDHAHGLTVPGALRGKQIEDQFELALIGSRLIAQITPTLAKVRNGAIAANVPASRKIGILGAVAREEARAAMILPALLEIMELCFNAAAAGPKLDFSEMTSEDMQAMAATLNSDSPSDSDEDAKWAGL